MSKSLSHKAAVQAFNNVFTITVTALIAFVVVHFYGWATYGKFSFFLSLFLLSAAFVINFTVSLLGGE